MSSMAAWLMQIDPWLPIWIGFSGSCCCLFIPLFLPETQPKPQSQSPTDPGGDDGLSDTSIEAAKKTAWTQTKEGVSEFKTAVAFFVQGNKHILMLLLTFLTTTLGKHSHDILLQFARKKYGWTWSQVCLASIDI